jgi:hypothetical protein
MAKRARKSAKVRGAAKKRKVARKKTSARARPKAKRRIVARRTTSTRARARAKRGTVAAAAAQGPVIDALKAQIAAGKIIFDGPNETRLKNQLLGLNTGTKVTRKLQSLVLELSRLAPSRIRISSLVRTSGHHGSGRAVDIGNEEIAGALLPQVATDAKVEALGIDELIFDATIAGEAPRNKWNYDRGVKHNYNSATLDQHGNHIHFAVKAG